MGKAILGLGLAMILTGVIAYVITSFASVTALIPAFFGVPIAFCGVAALKPARVKAAGIAAIVLALLGLGGTGSRLVPMILDGSIVLNAATVVQIVFTLLAVGVIVVGVGNAIKSRRS
ncbi:MAG: hypothetical protein RIB32_00485 [Phycisphaerales bacterium]